MSSYNFSRPAIDIVKKIQERPQKKHSKLKREQDRAEAQTDDLVTVRSQEVDTELHREAGPVHVGYHYWKKLGLPEILADVGMNEHAQMLTCVMTMNRLFAPGSEYAMPDWIRSVALPDILGEDFDSLSEASLYRNLDTLHPKRALIESRLTDRKRTLFNLDQTIFLYDLTSTYFEGQTKKNPKAKKGWSRDKRPDCNQVLVGLVVNRDGFPLGHEVFEGNMRDHKTVPTMLDLLDSRVGLQPGQTVAEEAFRSMKSPLSERPIFHQVERRVETHIFLCILAYHILISIEKTLRDKGVHFSFATVRNKLKTHQISTVILPCKDGSVLKIRKAGTPEAEHRELYKLLEVPKTIISPVRTWIGKDENT